MKKKPEERENGYKFITALMRPIFRFYYRPEIIGAEKIPTDGAVVIAGNHKHILDQCITIAATKRVIHYMAKKEYFDGMFAWFFRAAGCISVDRGNNDTSCIRSAMRVLKKDGAIGIFPEGTRNRTDEFLLDFKPGAVALAKKADAYIVPFGLTGDYKFRTKNLTIRYGEPFKAADMTVAEANQRLQSEVEKLMRTSIEEEKRKEA